MKIGSLFTGYGGLDLAAEAAFGAETAWVADIDKGACKIIAHRWGHVPNLGDVSGVDWSTVEPVDIITGGTPCQDLSHAGKRAGMTEGTRSNLWVVMREAIAQLRPAYVVWENVRGAYSAAADSDLEFCPGCMGARRPGTVLRALGRVLGDLSDLGYDARWHGLRAAEIGAPHGRFRVFIIAHRRDLADAGSEARLERSGLREGDEGGIGRGRSADGHREDELTPELLPTPLATGDVRSSHPGYKHLAEVLLPEEDAKRLLPTPCASESGGERDLEHRQASGSQMELSDVVRLLPTPRADGAHGESSEAHAARQARRAEAGEPPFSVPLHIAVERETKLLPTPMANGDSTSTHPAYTYLPEAIAKRHDGEEPLLPTPTAVPQSGKCRHGYGPQDLQHQLTCDCAGGVPSELGEGDRLLPTPTSRDHKGRNQRDDDTCLPGALLPTPTAGDSRASGNRPNASDVSLTDATVRRSEKFGQYAAAVERWEAVLGRPAPAPTEPTGRNGAERLSPKFVEWMMGLPEGWVTDVPGVSRNEALKACGNGVVPQQALAAILYGDAAGDVPAYLLPTPNAFHMGNTEQPQEWRERRADVFARTGTRHGPALPVVALSIAEGDPLVPETYMPDEDEEDGPAPKSEAAK